MFDSGCQAGAMSGTVLTVFFSFKEPSFPAKTVIYYLLALNDLLNIDQIYSTYWEISNICLYLPPDAVILLEIIAGGYALLFCKRKEHFS